MKLVIIEDEVAAATRLQKLLKKILPQAEFVFLGDSIESAVDWFTENKHYDLVFMDIQLADGLSFDIFERTNLTAPVIFTTAFDAYALKAFKVNSIDYILKPVDEKELELAVTKFKGRGIGFYEDNYPKLSELYRKESRTFRERFLVNKGSRFISVQLGDIACFYSEDKVSFIYTFDRQRYIWNQSLDEIEQSIKPELFFRAGRSLLVCAGAIASFEQGFNGKLVLHLNVKPEAEFSVSREKAQAFKQWLGH